VGRPGENAVEAGKREGDGSLRKAHGGNGEAAGGKVPKVGLETM